MGLIIKPTWFPSLSQTYKYMTDFTKGKMWTDSLG